MSASSSVQPPAGQCQPLCGEPRPARQAGPEGRGGHPEHDRGRAPHEAPSARPAVRRGPAPRRSSPALRHGIRRAPTGSRSTSPTRPRAPRGRSCRCRAHRSREARRPAADCGRSRHAPVPAPRSTPTKPRESVRQAWLPPSRVRSPPAQARQGRTPRMSASVPRCRVHAAEPNGAPAAASGRPVERRAASPAQREQDPAVRHRSVCRATTSRAPRGGGLSRPAFRRGPGAPAAGRSIDRGDHEVLRPQTA